MTAFLVFDNESVFTKKVDTMPFAEIYFENYQRKLYTIIIRAWIV